MRTGARESSLRYNQEDTLNKQKISYYSYVEHTHRLHHAQFTTEAKLKNKYRVDRKPEKEDNVIKQPRKEAKCRVRKAKNEERIRLGKEMKRDPNGMQKMF